MSVMGILLLITLFLALFLVTPSKGALASRDTIVELEESLLAKIKDADTLQAASVSLRIALAKMQDRPDKNQLESELIKIQENIVSNSNKIESLKKEITALDSSHNENIAKLGLTDLVDETSRLLEQAQQVRKTNTSDEAAVIEQQMRVTQARESLITLKKEANKLWLIPSTKGNNKEPLLITVSAGGIVLNRFNRPEDKQEFNSSKAIGGLKREMAGMNPAKDYIIFYIRPSGVKLFKSCREITDRSRFQIGFDAVEENTELIFTRNLE